jgi:hypothetical protein
MTPTAIMTPMAWIARRSVKASIYSFHCSPSMLLVETCSSIIFGLCMIGKPVSTFPDHALCGGGRRCRLEKEKPRKP